jgi:predicted SAM-dependent methyltransferase
MPKLKSTINFRDVTFYENEPDQMWLMEVEKLIPWLSGKGADIGCGLRTVFKDSIRVDADPNVRPEICCDGDKLPFKDGELDYITSVHTFEHFKNQIGLLREWLRVLKRGGIIAIVHPDVDYTKKQKKVSDNPSLQENPFNYHYTERNHDEFVNWIRSVSDIGFKLIDHGVACQNWSFFIILEKT